MDWYRIGAEKRLVEGGLSQMSVEAGALMVNSEGGVPSPGTLSFELANLNCGMVGYMQLRGSRGIFVGNVCSVATPRMTGVSRGDVRIDSSEH